MTAGTDDHFDEGIGAHAVALLEELCAISSPSGHEAGLLRMAQRLGVELESHGLGCEVIHEPNGAGGTDPVLVARGGKRRARPAFCSSDTSTPCCLRQRRAATEIGSSVPGRST